MNSITLGRMLRRLMLPVAVGGFLVLAFSYGFQSTPSSDLLLTDSYAPGTTCLIAKRPERLPPGANVFVATADGLALARVRHADEHFVHLADRGGTVFPDGVPRAAIRGLVLAGFGGTSPDPSSFHAAR